jgi:cell division protein ZapA (FtsZ GTPase activity inhibitor)
MGESTQINVLGTNFSIQTDEDPEYLRKVISYLKEKIKQIEASVPTKEPLRISLMASILIIDELFKARASRGANDIEEVPQAEEIASRIIDRIDQALLEQ